MTAMNPNLDGISDSTHRAAAEKELAAVRDVFTRENLIAGLTILANVGEALGWKDKPLYFARHGSWLDGLIQSLGVHIEKNAQPAPAKTGQAPANDAVFRRKA